LTGHAIAIGKVGLVQVLAFAVLDDIRVLDAGFDPAFAGAA